MWFGVGFARPPAVRRRSPLEERNLRVVICLSFCGRPVGPGPLGVSCCVGRRRRRFASRRVVGDLLRWVQVQILFVACLKGFVKKKVGTK